MRIATELFLIDEANQKILLGLKKTGIGTGNVLGIGGHVDAGETPSEAVVREMFEETTLVVDKADLSVGPILTFLFPHKPDWDMRVHNFTATKWRGSPEETDEIRPKWYPLSNIPYPAMWDDAKYWLARYLAGEVFEATVIFSADNKTVAEIIWETEKA